MATFDETRNKGIDKLNRILSDPALNDANKVAYAARSLEILRTMGPAELTTAQIMEQIEDRVGENYLYFSVDPTYAENNFQLRQFKTIKAAIDGMPYGAYAQLSLGDGEHVINENIFCDGKTIYIKSNTGNAKIIFEQTEANTLNAFNISAPHKAGLRFYKVTLEVRDNLPSGGYEYHQSFVKNTGIVDVYLSYCTINRKNLAGAVVYNHGAWGAAFSIVGVYNNNIILGGVNPRLIILQGGSTTTYNGYGGTLDYPDQIIGGIVLDADSGNPLNVLSGTNFSS